MGAKLKPEREITGSLHEGVPDDLVLALALSAFGRIIPETAREVDVVWGDS